MSQWDGWFERYIADSQPQRGDRFNTGSSYVADCGRDKITITRQGLFKSPLVTTIALTGDQLYYEQYLQSPKPNLRAMILKKVN
ncbi:MAG: hypothetical protein H7328_05630 [Bdellovibrio sp.]|nr:hypothetical protein [Bdellovibrio sp.]